MIDYGTDYPDPLAERGADLLDDVRAWLLRFVAFPTEYGADAVALWVAHTHELDAFESTPRLAALSPEPGSGKTRLLECVECLVPRALMTVNASSAALFRKVSDPDGKPTLLMDEADTVFGPRASKEHEDLRGFVNAGHRRGATAIRCVIKGRTVEVEELPAYAAVALAGLDDLPDTIMSRSLVLRMRRRSPDEIVEPFRHRLHAREGHALRDRLATWMAEHRPRLVDAWPQMPDGVEDRAADVWEPLIAIADQAGDDWPERARVAAVALVADSRKAEGQSLGVRLLADIRTVIGDRDRISTEELLHGLHDLDEAPWAELRGKPLDARGLAQRLAKYQVKSKVLRIGDHTPRGYERADLLDPWARYLTIPTSLPGSKPFTPHHTPEGYMEEANGGMGPLFGESATSATSATTCDCGSSDTVDHPRFGAMCARCSTPVGNR